MNVSDADTARILRVREGAKLLDDAFARHLLHDENLASSIVPMFVVPMIRAAIEEPADMYRKLTIVSAMFAILATYIETGAHPPDDFDAWGQLNALIS